MKRILKSELDKFYTKKDLAKLLIEKTNIQNYGLVIEPSCGDGAFYTQMIHNYKIGIDIEPESLNDVLEADYLTWEPNIIEKCWNLDNSEVLVIGNPPFGKQGSLAMKFVNKSAEYADTIAFILPLSFMKESVKNRIPEYFHLRTEEILDENSFEVNGSDFPVKCCFQIWDKKDYKREQFTKIEANNFTYTKDKTLADLSIRRVGVYAGRGFDDTSKSEQSHYFIILNDKSKKQKLIKYLDACEWNDLTVGPRSISKSELNEKINHFL